MSEETIIIDHDENESVTTTKFKQTKSKVAEFVKSNKKAILLTAGSTAMLGLGAVVLSLTKKDDTSDPYLAFDFNDDASELTVTDPTSGDSWNYGELDAEGASDETSNVEINSEEHTITESTE